MNVKELVDHKIEVDGREAGRVTAVKELKTGVRITVTPDHYGSYSSCVIPYGKTFRVRIVGVYIPTKTDRERVVKRDEFVYFTRTRYASSPFVRVVDRDGRVAKLTGVLGVFDPTPRPQQRVEFKPVRENKPKVTENLLDKLSNWAKQHNAG